MGGGALRIEQAQIAGLAFDRRNPRRMAGHEMVALRRSLEEYGAVEPAVVNADGTIIGGHMRVEAARRLGWDEFPVVRVELDDARARLLNLALNRIHGEWDEAMLAEMLSQLHDEDADLALSGFDSSEVDRLLASVDVESGRDTEPMEPPAEPQTRAGDLWVLGDHRLLCGDATNRESVAWLMNRHRADLMVTDPPYGVAVGNDKGKLSINGDLTQALIPISFVVALEVLTDHARLYLFGGSSNWAMYSGLFDAHLRMQVRPIVWVKNGFVLRPNNYHSGFEMVYFGWKGRGGDAKHWYGDRRQVDVWQIARDAARDKLHPTQKPVEACEIPIRNSCPPAGIVYEPFAGSGPTLIAAENLRRRCYAMEIDPAYCDVIVDRWERHTGKEAILGTDRTPVQAHA